jgi:hypothetical protein
VADENFIAHCRSFGVERLRVAASIHTARDAERMWRQPANPFAFTFADCWKHTVALRIMDFPAEVGFYVDVLGFAANAVSTDYVMLTSPRREFYLSLVQAGKRAATPPETISLEFMVSGLRATVDALRARGIAVSSAAPLSTGSPLHRAWLDSPNGFRLTLWGFERQPATERTPASTVVQQI